MDTVGFRAFVVLSNSMEPRINVDDLIIIRRVDEPKLEVGDIITIVVYIPEIGEETYVTHYLGAIETSGDENVYRTRGINLAEDEYDDWVDDDGEPIVLTFDDIEGKYLFRIPYVGYLQRALNSKVILGLLLVNFGVIYLLVKYIKRNDTEDIDEDE